MKTFDARTRERWRRWLAKHHAIGVGSLADLPQTAHRQAVGRVQDALDEALCYGWIDSLIKRIDDDRYARKFTPRKAESNWSSINIKRYNELKAAKKLAAPGLRAARKGGRSSIWRAADKVPAYIEKAIKQDARAWKFFESLAPSYRRLYIDWIDSAKRDETKQTRLRQAIEMLK